MLKKFIFILFFIFLFNLPCLTEEKAPELKQPLLLLIDDLSNATFREKIADYLQEVLQVPPQYDITVNFANEYVSDNLIVLEVTFSDGKNTQKEKFYLTADRKFLITGKVYDLSKDYREEVLKKISIKNSATKGNAKAKVTIIEFSDFQCPYCSKAYNVLEKEVLPKYKDKVKLIFKHCPLKSIHPWAEDAAVAAECMYLQNKKSFWTAYKFFFDNQQSLNKDNFKDNILTVVNNEKINQTKFLKCFDNKETSAKIDADIKEADAVGVNSVPTFFINGKIFKGAQPAENFISVIEEELKKK